MPVYYVDNAGSNADTGLVGHPWQTCAKVSGTTFAAGDQIIFTAGQTFTGPLTITNSGASGNYICVGTGRLTPATAGTTRTAQDTPATITCPDGGNGISVTNCEYVSLDNLIVSGSGVNTSTGSTTSTGIGITLFSTQASVKLNGNRITACTVTGCKNGIWAWTANGSHKGYAGLQVWGCVVYACQQVGFILWTSPFGTGSTTQNSDVYVGSCHIYDLPGKPGGSGVGNCGEGITIRNCTTGTVEYCVAHDLNTVGDQGAGGTSAFDGGPFVDGITIQYCEAYHIFAHQVSVAPADGVGIDFESAAANCVAQYNYIHDCDGAGYLTGAQASTGHTNSNAIRFNVFARNAGVHQAELYSFNSVDGGIVVSSACYMNTIYASHGDCYSNAGGYSTKSQDALIDNILVAKAASFCVDGTIAQASLYGNLYYAIGGGGIKVRPDGSNTYTSMATLRAAGYEVSGGSSGVNADPLLAAPTTSTAGSLPDQPVTVVNGFDLGVLSPARNAGVDISGIATLVHDFHNVPTTTAGANIGAIIAPIPAARLGWS